MPSSTLEIPIMTDRSVHPTSQLAVKISALTDVGRVRSGNEDNFLVIDLETGFTWTADSDPPENNPLTITPAESGLLCAVSDGMGGAAAGEVASKLAVAWSGWIMSEACAHPDLKIYPFHERLRLAIEQANIQIAMAAEEAPEFSGMGATFTAAGIQGSTLTLAQVGDSRAYLIRNGHMVQLTRDQSLVAQLIEMGSITEEEAEFHPYRNVIMQALGANAWVEVAVQVVNLCQGDLVLLCSDGLSGKVRKDQMQKLISEVSSDLRLGVRKLIYAANEAGGDDNITAVLLRFNGDHLPDPDGDPVTAPQSLERDRSLPRRVEIQYVSPQESESTLE